MFCFAEQHMGTACEMKKINLFNMACNSKQTKMVSLCLHWQHLHEADSLFPYDQLDYLKCFSAAACAVTHIIPVKTQCVQ